MTLNSCVSDAIFNSWIQLYLTVLFYASTKISYLRYFCVLQMLHLCSGYFFWRYFFSDLGIATFHLRAYLPCDRIASDYLWFSLLIPYVRWSVLPWREEWRKKIISLYGFRTCPRRRKRYCTVCVLYCPRLFIVANAIQFWGFPIPRIRVRDTWNLPMIQIPPVSFPLIASQIARYIDMKSCMILESLL